MKNAPYLCNQERTNTKHKIMKATIEMVTEKATKFLAIADELNEKVSRYFDFSNDVEDVKAYETVRAADKEFIDALNAYWDESYEYGLNYELAESFAN